MQTQNSIVPETDIQETLPPLQPLNFTEILDGMFTLYRKHFRLYFMIATVYFVISYGFDIIRNWVSVSIVSGALVSQRNLEIMNMIFISLLGLFITGALLYATAHVFLGKNINATSAVQQSLRRYLILFGAFFIYVLVCGGLSITIIGIPFGFYFLVRWCLYSLPILSEESSSMNSLRRSSELVKGSWWRVFGITLAIFLIYFIIYIILIISVAIIFFLIPGTGDFFATATTLETMVFMLEPTPHVIGWGLYLFWSFIVTSIEALTMPILSIGYTLLYFDMRIRKEAYDLEMQATTPDDQIPNP